MSAELREFIKKRFQIGENEGINKVCDLKESILKNVKPGMMLHLPMCGPRWPSAAIYELARQFWGKRPNFTIATLSANFPVAILVHGGLVKKIITSYWGDPYKTPSPNKAYEVAYNNRTLEIEAWTLLTFSLRLMAGAMGVGFTPTRSLIRSSMAEENKDSFMVIDDPFGSGRKIGLLKALNPDLSIIHAWAADHEGNAVFLPPYAEDFYGAMASRRGVLLTAEKIVSTEFIRAHSHLVRLPGNFVLSVSEMPMGAHPAGVINQNISDENYMEDYDFVDQARLASKDPDKWDKWVKEWVLGCQDHQDYLKKVGTERLLFLKGKADKDSWEYEFEAYSADLEAEKYTPIEMAVVVGARKVKERILKQDYQTVLAGAGIPNLAAWLAYYELKELGREVQLMAEPGLFGYSPRPFDPSIFNQRNLPTCKSLTNTHMILGIFAAGENNHCLGVLGAAQVDKYGNINTTRIDEPTHTTLLVGSGGANDTASAAREVVVVAIQKRDRFLDRVPYITSPGKGVKTLVSTLGVFEKLADNPELTLTGYFPHPALSTAEEHIHYIKENCEWELKVSPHIEQASPPTSQELIMLRTFDPQRWFLGKKA
jgi:acyl CoA:acetate/3-ketoacid CoA transferase alpha subunit/acyl CoA:acetate/3-ketoacid CoA transferase beta subunit